MKWLTTDELYEQAHIAACEIDSPNSIEFDAIHEHIFEEMAVAQDHRAQHEIDGAVRALRECVGMLNVGLSALNKTEGDAIRVQVMKERAEVCIDILRKQIAVLTG